MLSFLIDDVLTLDQDPFREGSIGSHFNESLIGGASCNKGGADNCPLLGGGKWHPESPLGYWNGQSSGPEADGRESVVAVWCVARDLLSGNVYSAGPLRSRSWRASEAL